MIAQIVTCPNCQTNMAESARYCPGCGQPRSYVRDELRARALQSGVSFEMLLEADREESLANSIGERLAAYLTPKFEYMNIGLQYHKGFLGIGSGWDKQQVADIERIGDAGFELVTAIPAGDGYMLFFKRQLQ